MSTRTVAVLVAVALFALGVSGALWAADALRAPGSSSVDLIELDREVLDERDERDGTDKKKDRKKDRSRPRKGGGANPDRVQAPSGGSDRVQPPSGGSDDSSGGAPVVPPPPPEDAGDKDDDREGGDNDGEGRDD